MTTTASVPRRTAAVRRGGRSERVVQAVLDAALGELAAVGYPALRLEDVAVRAGVAKTTLYRRWPTKHELIAAALREAIVVEREPDTGSLRADLLLMIERTVKRIATPRGLAVARVLVSEGDPDLDRMSRAMRDDKRAQRTAIVERAKLRGELPGDVDPLLITEPLFAFVVSRLLRFGERTPRATCSRLIDLLVTGAEHGGGTARRGRSTRKRS